MKRLFLILFCSLLSAQTTSLTFEPESLDFGTIVWGNSYDLSFTIGNSGDEVVNVDDIISSTEEISVSLTSFPVFPGGTVPLTVTYNPVETGQVSETLTIMSDDPGDGEYVFNISANKVAHPIASVNPSTLEYAIIPDDSDCQYITIFNDGYGDLNWSASWSSEWVDVIPSSAYLEPLSDMTAQVCTNSAGLYFGDYQDQITITTDDPVNLTLLVDVSLTVLPPVISIDPESLSFDVVMAEDTLLTQSLTINNSGDYPLEWEASSSMTSDDIDELNTVYQFSTCGASGRYGPSQGQCEGAYGSGYVVVNNGIQEWTVPYSGIYSIEVGGAEGGLQPEYNYGGDGAIMGGDFVLGQGQTLKILVGHKGENAGSDDGAGGGGGTFIVLDDDTPRIIAGGGGGDGAEINNFNAGNGNIYEDIGGYYGIPATSPGYGGNCYSSGSNSAGAGGFYSDGCSNNGNSYYGHSFLNGGIGGGAENSQDGDGGFGGGSGGVARELGGGGGGYTGGASGNNNDGGQDIGQGGGSYNAGINQYSNSGANGGDGYAIITLIEIVGYAEWLSLSSEQDTIEAFSSQTIDLTVNGADFDFGSYETSVDFNSNDPENPTVTLPVTMNVYYPVSNIDMTPISHGEVGFNGGSSIDVAIANEGNYPLVVMPAFAVGASGSFDLTVTPETLVVEPDSVGAFTISVTGETTALLIVDTLLLSTTEVGYPSYSIPISATVVPDEKPVILSFTDRPDDQGGYAFITFTRSYMDTSTPEGRETELYTIWYEDDGGWISISSLGALGDNQYTALIPTASDSTASDTGLYDYRVSAHMDEGTWISETYQGYTVDNIVPATPQQFSAELTGADCQLSWQGVTDDDLSHYSIYRDGEHLTDTNGTVYLDADMPYAVELSYYVVAVDIHDNPSQPSEEMIILQAVGDVNGDLNLNVLDLILIVNNILQPDLYPFTEDQFNLADANTDGMVNILDVVLLMNIVLEQNDSLGRTSNEVTLKIHPKGIEQYNSVSAGYQITINHAAGITIDLTNNAMLAKTVTDMNQSTIIILNPEDGWLFTSNEPFEILEVIAASGNQLIGTSLIMVPDSYVLNPAYPNPFNPLTTIEYGLSEDGLVEILVYDMQGRLIETLINSYQPAGYHQITWNAKTVASGLYLLHFKAGLYNDYQKIMLMK